MHITFVFCILILFATFPGPVHAQTCESIFRESDKSVGYLNQNDRIVREAGLFPDDPKRASQMCGPSCLLNSALRLGGFRIQRTAAANELRFIAEDLASAVGVRPASLRNGGMSGYDLANLASRYYTQLGFSPRAQVFGVEVSAETLSEAGRAGRTNILLENIRPQAGRVVIVNYEHWRTSDLRKIKAGDKSTGWTAGHFVILDSLKLETNGSARAVFHDPGRGRDRAISLRDSRDNDLGIKTFELVRDGFPNFKKSDSSIRTVVTNVIVVDLFGNESFFAKRHREMTEQMQKREDFLTLLRAVPASEKFDLFSAMGRKVFAQRLNSLAVKTRFRSVAVERVFRGSLEETEVEFTFREYVRGTSVRTTEFVLLDYIPHHQDVWSSKQSADAIRTLRAIKKAGVQMSIFDRLSNQNAVGILKSVEYAGEFFPDGEEIWSIKGIVLLDAAGETKFYHIEPLDPQSIQALPRKK